MAVTSPRFLSFAIDLALIDGGKWWDPAGNGRGAQGSIRATPVDLASPRLRALTQALGPAYLRVGGTEADVAFYDLANSDSTPHPLPLPAGDQSRLTGARFSELAAFAAGTGNELVFDLNAGPSTRDSKNRWRPEEAESLLTFAKTAGTQVAAWELGNEINAYPFTLGLSHRVSGTQYAKDFRAANALRLRLGLKAPILGPASAYWPILGEPLGLFFGVMKPFLKHAPPLDVITWHFYPTQSRRCPVAVRRSSPERLVKRGTLDEVSKWARKLNALRDRYQPQAAIWLGESGSAQCGGEPGLSDRFASSLWWLDELGSLARLGTQVVVRQSLVGADYGMLGEADFEPRPDYWASLLWKKLMGEKVLAASLGGKHPPRDLRVYAHCAHGGSPPDRSTRGAITLLLVNLSAKETIEVGARDSLAPYELYLGTARALTDGEVRINGVVPTARADGKPAGLEPVRSKGAIALPPRSYAFAVFPDARAAACGR